MPSEPVINKPSTFPGRDIPQKMIIDIKKSGVFMGLDDCGKRRYVGKLAESDGNVMVLGTNGSGKSRILVMSTIVTWKDVFVVLDVKGELWKRYHYLHSSGIVKRPYIVFDPSSSGGGAHYDVYAMLNKDDPNYIQYVREIAYAIIPKPLDARDLYWIDMARDLLIGVVVYYYELGLSFIDTIMLLHSKSTADMCKEIILNGSDIARSYVSEISGLKPEQQASIGTELKRHTMIFATDPRIQSALSNDEDGLESFSWKSIVSNPEAPNVFLSIEQSMLEQWSGVLRLMITQLIRQLERRPEQYSQEGHNMKPLLLLLDEFKLLGKMDVITNAITTLRSKKVTMYIVLQSLAQLDAVYGNDVRKILMDNCQYKVILKVCEPETQAYLSRLIGDDPTARVSASRSLNSSRLDEQTLGVQVQEMYEPLIRPHQFGTNMHIWIHTTDYRFLSTLKWPIQDSWRINYDFEFGTKSILIYSSGTSTCRRTS